MITLTRKGNKVYFGEKELTINPQSTKGQNKEVVSLKGIEGTNGQKWISLSKLKEGENNIECQGREVTSSVQYLPEEVEELERLEKRIKEIKEKAKLRKPIKIDLNMDITKLNDDQKQSMIVYLTQHLDKLNQSLNK